MNETKQDYYIKEEKEMILIWSNILKQQFDKMYSFVDKMRDQLKIPNYSAVYFLKSDYEYFEKCGIINDVQRQKFNSWNINKTQKKSTRNTQQ